MKTTMLIRLFILLIIMIITIVTSGTKNQWILVEGPNTLARIWFSASLFITLVSTCWINISFSSSIRYKKDFLGIYSGFITGISYLSAFYIAFTIFMIYYGKITDIRNLTLFGGFFLVLIVSAFDFVVYKAEKLLLEKSPNEKLEENQVNLKNASASFFYLDIPISLGVLVTTLVCFILSSTTEQNFIPGFAAGATGMQIIVANVAFEIIHS